MKPEREIDTDKIERVASAVAMRAAERSDRSDKHDRISNLESEVNTIKENLHEGSIQFVKLGNAIDNLANTLGTLQKLLYFLFALAATGIMTFTGSIIWWNIKMYATASGAGS